MVKIIDSVAAVFCHEGRIFTVRRQSHLQDFPGYDSFPGGKLDAADPDSRHPGRLLRDWEGRQMHTLVRELREELDYDLPAAIHAGQVNAVKYLATALAPAIVPLRFRLHFFRIDLLELPQFTPDSGEIAETCWQTPQQLLDRFHQGDALMVPPLRWVLEALCKNPGGSGFGDLSQQFDETSVVPRLEQLSGLQVLPIISNTLPPATRTNAFLLGDADAPQILVDPSPASPAMLENLLRTLSQDRLSALFITHHHPDHHEHAPELARRLNVPIWMSEDTHSRILQRWGANYFSGVRVEFKQSGDGVTRWKGEIVRVYAVPGHDAGQLALAPESLRWFLVGDLIQGAGTVVIPAPEGDMATYMQTLERIIELDPAVIVPSHSQPMRGTFRLRATLQHRREREATIRQLLVEGKTEADIFEILYRGVGKRLGPMALNNIRAHLVKLKQEGLI
jgi:glyoxylase-like metal-dependent hydrolase (beta-lactamase superfamily II)/8-oxo-dGTP pyrophosphatase MutT (NUDIX family)